jgi:voltage-gated potassium channel|tara:strand:- start:91 stop:876 length:786 start_codon:yes stop_codon:yes gene_type:complete
MSLKQKDILSMVIRLLTWVSVSLYFIEIAIGSSDSRAGWAGFLWAERVIAVIFTFEYFARWKNSKGDKYATSALGIIDLLAIIPFWVGFVVPVAALELIRTLRVLRLLKLFRYNRSLQLVALAYYRSIYQLRFIAFATMIVGLFCCAGIYEVESKAQPEVYDGLFAAFWYFAVTIATVGYGDVFPITIIGRLLGIVLMGTGIVTFAGAVGIVGQSFSEVLADEKDPNVDPIQKFKEEKQRQKALNVQNDEWSAKQDGFGGK